jgi:hypothetical protein
MGFVGMRMPLLFRRESAMRQTVVDKRSPKSEEAGEDDWTRDLRRHAIGFRFARGVLGEIGRIWGG